MPPKQPTPQIRMYHARNPPEAITELLGQYTSVVRELVDIRRALANCNTDEDAAEIINHLNELTQHHADWLVQNTQPLATGHPNPNN